MSKQAFAAYFPKPKPEAERPARRGLTLLDVARAKLMAGIVDNEAAVVDALLREVALSRRVAIMGGINPDDAP